MKRLILVTALLSGTAQAQIPVTDVASIVARTLEHGLSMAEMALQLEELIRQYEQLRDTHDAITGIRNLGDVFDNPELRTYLPDDWVRAYRALKRSGYEGLVREGIAIYEENKVYDACSHLELEDMRLDCESRAIKASQDQGDFTNAYDMITSRTAQIKQLQSQINTTEDPKAIAELQARISIEQAAIANEASRMDLMGKVTSAEQQVQQQRQREYQARAWAATKGVDIEPLTFGD